MKKKGNLLLLAFMLLALILLLPGCQNGNGEPATTAKVRVVGSAQTSANARSTTLEFASGDVHVDGNDITAELTPTADTTATDGSNNVTFEAEVPVEGATVAYSVSPRAGFVFDEWEIDKAELKRAFPTTWRTVLREIRSATAGDAETIEIDPELIQYLRPHFDRGGYFDPNGNSTDPDGTKEDPYNKLEQIAAAILVQPRRSDEIEFTIKAKTGDLGAVNLSSLSYLTASTEEIEIKLIGGHDDNWTVTGKTTVTSLTLPSLSNTELEIEVKNVAFTTLDWPSGGKNLEIKFENCEVGTLNGASGKVVDGLVITNLADGTTGATFVDSRVPYLGGNSYYHSIITGYTDGEIKGLNNIVFLNAGATAVSTDNNNLYLEADDQFEGFMDNAMATRLDGANPMTEDQAEHLFGDEDILEEDIAGRDRRLPDDDDRQVIPVSYGPYEYKNFDD